MMRTYHTAVLAVLLPSLLQAQKKPYTEPFLLVPPGIDVRIERYAPLIPSRRMSIGELTADRTGFLWCLTSEGLARSDGYDLKVFRDELADTAGGFRRVLAAVAVDGEGYIWVGTPNGGLKKLDPVTGKSRWYIGGWDDSTSIGTGATRLLVTCDGELWAGGRFGLARYNRETDSFVRYNLPAGWLHPHFVRYDLPAHWLPPRRGVDFPIAALCERDRSIWVGLGPVTPQSKGGGFAEFNRDTRSWTRFLHDASTGRGPSDDAIVAMCADQSGGLWVGTRAGLDRYDPGLGTWRHFSVLKSGISLSGEGTFPVSSTGVVTMVSDEFGGIWLGTDGAGIFRIDPTTGKVLQFRHDDTDANSIPYDFVGQLSAPRSRHNLESPAQHSEPASSSVYISHGVEGAHRALVRKDPCTGVVVHFESGTIGPLVCALLHESTEKIWTGTYNGRIGLFDLQARMVKWYPQPTAVRQLIRLRDNRILASNRSSKAWITDLRRDAFTPFLPELNISTFLEENDSLVWLGCLDDLGMTFLAAANSRTGTYTAYPRHNPDSASTPEGCVIKICDDRRGGLWYGANGGGLLRFDRERKTYRRYLSNPGADNALVDNIVFSVIPDSGGTLWVATASGLALMDCDRGTFEHFHTTRQPEDELLIRGMVDDGEGHLWIAADQGALCFTKATKTFRTLTPPEQFRHKYFWGVMFDHQSRTVTIGGLKGFFRFSIDTPPPASDPPPVVFTSFQVFEKPYPLDREVWALKSITLPHSASFFSFTYAVLDHLNPAWNQYMYRLEGLDPEWIHAGSRRYVSYTNLDPGTYLFRVRGANTEGMWTNKEAAIQIVILPPWYRTIWAYIAYALLAGGLLYGSWRFDRRRTALKHILEMKSFEAAKMREVDAMKSAFFANISHEFRTPLTLILGPLEQLAERFRNDDLAQSTFSTMRRNGLRLLQLINQLLDLSRMDAGKMTVQVRSLELVDLSRALVMSFQSLADRKKINLIFDPEEDEILAYADRDKFEKILTNLLSNAFKFTGEGGEIKVVLRILDEEKDMRSRAGPPGRRIELVVSDTGIGIEAKQVDKVFDRFYQVQSSQTQENGGTGIGLALAKDLVGILKGEITVESTPGHGSTFAVRLPIDKEEWSPEEFAAEEQADALSATRTPGAVIAEEMPSQVPECAREPGKPVVLIVEDNADVRTYVCGFLEKNFTVEEAENGKTGLEKAREMGIDLVISDIMMPVMDGIQLCRELKDDDRTSHIPIILLTAKATSEGKLEGLDIGADDYIVKPFDARELLARVKNLIETRRKLWEKYHRQVTLGPMGIPVASADERFLKRLAECIERHIADVGYDSEALAHDLCMSRMQLNRKLNALTGKSTHEVVREFRLQRAAELLRNRAGNIAGVAYDVGFSSLSHFARSFRERFGFVPSEYGEMNSPKNGGANQRPNS